MGDKLAGDRQTLRENQWHLKELEKTVCQVESQSARWSPPKAGEPYQSPSGTEHPSGHGGAHPAGAQRLFGGCKQVLQADRILPRFQAGARNRHVHGNTVLAPLLSQGPQLLDFHHSRQRGPMHRKCFTGGWKVIV